MPARPDSGREPLPSFPAPWLASEGEPLPATRADPDRPLGHIPASVTVLDQESFEVGNPNIARIYDALLGGKDNYAVDREAALALTAAIPGAARAARDNRAFLDRAVHYLASECEITQFLDIGSGLPTAMNTHDVAQAANPKARVVYVDSDRVVVSHARALLAKAPRVLAVEDDLRFPRQLLGRKDVRSFLDFRKPVAVLLVAVLHFLDGCEPWQAVEAIAKRIAPGSYVVISHVGDDQISAEAVDRAHDIYAGFAPGTARSRTQIMTMFDGLRLVEPGLVDVAAWRSGLELPQRPTIFWAGVGRKPGAEDDQ
jgi:SAM-dependent methyltransferase